MDRNQILQAIDEEITRLESVRALLGAANGHRSLNGSVRSTGTQSTSKKRVLSEEARNRIAQAQKRRWAKHRKETAQAAK